MRPSWAFLPALGGALAHAPVLRYDLLASLRRPLDGGASVGGTRLFGDNKTLRGALVMAGGTTVAAIVLARRRWFRERLPRELREAPPAAYGATLGAGVVLGELPNSFAKRRLGIAPGDRQSSLLGAAIAVYDQADFVPMSALTLRPLWRMTALEVAETFAVVAAVHSAVNVVGYVLGARTSPV
jgi:CDP-2,3-bis-(O-geranylgeranyl)-sn-glycerol synthase